MLSPVPYKPPGVGGPLCLHGTSIRKARYAFGHQDKKNVGKPTKDPPMEQPTVKFTFALSVATSPRFLRYIGAALGYHGESPMIGKEYFVRQAVILFDLAKATKDPKISAALLEKAADLKLQVDDRCAPNLTPLAPDIEPPAM
jgi:hypothetical protein